MNLVFRTDASSIAGSGHVMRCLTLAKAMRERGAEVSFVCRAHDGHLGALILEAGFSLHLLNGCDGSFDISDEPLSHGCWLGNTQAVDADQTLKVLNAMSTKPDWIVLDHYGIDYRWETFMRPAVGRIMVIDDLADRIHNCDILLDQNLVAQMKSRYVGKVPTFCKQLLGPSYVLLPSDYADRHLSVQPRKGTVERIFIYFGGADVDNLTGLTLSAFLSLMRNDIRVDVVLANNVHAQEIRKKAANHSNIHIFDRLPSLAELIERASLGIGACGSTNWERLCLGLPSIVIAIADNQVSIAEEIGRRGLACSLGFYQQINETDIASKLTQIIGDGLSEDWSQQCLSVVDGCGVKRICAVLDPESAGMQIRRATPGDEGFLLDWANDPLTRRNAFDPAYISTITHKTWFDARLKNSNRCRIYIAETSDGIPLGQVRFERFKNGWEVHYSLSPDFRGFGLGRQMLEKALASLADEFVNVFVIGRVRYENHASLRIFELLGFDARFDAKLKIVTVKKNFQSQKI